MANFPTLDNGSLCQRPVSRTTRFLISKIDVDSGQRYARYRRATPLLAWTLTLMLTDADLATIQAHWTASQGSYAEFTFTDPDDGTTYTKVRYDMDRFEVQHLGPRQHRVIVKLAQYA